MSDGERIRSRLLVGADGLRSVVVRRLRLVARPPRLRKLALTARLSGLTTADDRGELHLVPRGTIGIAPVGEGLVNVTIVVAGDEAARVAGGREAYYDRMLEEEPRLRGAARVSPVLATGPFDLPVRTAVADGALLVGDAAGYYDPFTGQGIYRALRGAAAASEVANLALRRGEVSEAALMPYERARRRLFAPGERLQRVIERFVAHPALLRMAGRVLASRPTVADTLVAVTGDVLPVRALCSPRTLSRLLG
jgi:flavin-dependent dehydrogenase